MDRRVAQESVDVRILRGLRRIIRAVDIHSRKLSSKYQITTPQLITLMCIVDEGPIGATEIGRRVQLSGSTIVGILDRLEAKGLVRRERSTEDRRMIRVEATSKGVEVARTAPSPLQDELVTRLAGLSEQERVKIVESVERIVYLMHAQEVDAAPILDVGDVKRSVEPTA